MTQTGFVLLFVIPTGVVSLVWVTIYGGNIALTWRSVIAPYLKNMNGQLVKIIAVSFACATIGYLAGWLVSWL